MCTIVFFGGMSYLPLFCRLTSKLNAERVVLGPFFILCADTHSFTALVAQQAALANESGDVVMAESGADF